MARARRKPRKPPIPTFEGDHGTGTAAAVSGTIVEALPTENGKPDPNNRGRRRRMWLAEQYMRDGWLTKEQAHAGIALHEAFEKIGGSSGTFGDVRVDLSPNGHRAPRGIKEVSFVRHALRRVPKECSAAVVAVTCENRPIFGGYSFKMNEIALELSRLVVGLEALSRSRK